jgi:hypothetical protein
MGKSTDLGRPVTGPRDRKISRVDPAKLSPARIEDAPRNARPRLLRQSIKFFRDQLDQVDPAGLHHEAARPVKRRISTTPGADSFAAGHARCPADYPQRETLEQQRQETFTQFRGGYPRRPPTARLKRWTTVVLSVDGRHRCRRCPQWRHIRELDWFTYHGPRAHARTGTVRLTRAGCVCLSMSVQPPSDVGSAHRLAFGLGNGASHPYPNPPTPR